MNNDYQLWYVESAYEAAGRPKMEHALMAYARKYFLYCTVYERDLNDIVSNLKAAQDRFYESNKRLKKCDIVLTEPFSFLHDGSMYGSRSTRNIRIGAQSLFLRKVREEIGCVDPQFPYAYDYDLSGEKKA